MDVNEFISANEFCNHYQIEESFLHTIYELGLINLRTFDNELYISWDDFSLLKTIVNLHFNLQINPQGIDAIFNLLNKIKEQQSEIVSLKTRLSLFEELD